MFKVGQEVECVSDIIEGFEIGDTTKVLETTKVLSIQENAMLLKNKNGKEMWYDFSFFKLVEPKLSHRIINEIMEEYDLEDGEEFMVGDYKFKIENYCFYYNNNNAWYEYSLDLDDIDGIQKLPWQPKEGEDFFIVDEKYDEGYNHLYNYNGNAENLVNRGVKFYRTEEEVKAEVERLIESGEWKE